MPRRKTSHVRQVGLIVVLLLVLVGCASYGLVRYFSGDSGPPSVVKVKIDVPPAAVSARSRVLFMGTTYWGRYTNRAAENSSNKLTFPFEKLHSLDRKQYDTWVANLECPLSSKVNLSAEQEDDSLSFNCSPEYLPEAAKWFDVFGSANNHSDNQGEEAFAETRQHLEEHKIQYFGHYDPDRLDEVCEIIGISFTVTYDRGGPQDHDLPVAMCGFHGVFKIPGEESLRQMEQYSKYMPVIAYPHSGAEYKAQPDNLKQQLYRNMIDHGADMVIGDHPHWVQSTEVYKGKPIIYSMGNFMFDQQYNDEVVRSAAIDVVFEATGEDLSRWIALDSCRHFHDDCLIAIQRSDLSRLDTSFRYSFVPTENRGYQVKKASGVDAQAIRNRLDWDQLVTRLQSPHGPQ